MLAKKYRLPIQSVFKKSGQSRKGRYFLIKIFPSRLEYSRFGVIISKKVALKAVIRNRIKRLFFNSFKELIFKFSPKDFLIIISPSINSLSGEEIKKEIKKSFENV